MNHAKCDVRTHHEAPVDFLAGCLGMTLVATSNLCGAGM